MTLYYFKSDGSIHSWCTSINNMSIFTGHGEDYTLMLDYIVLPLDRYVLDNIKYFTIDIDTKELCFNAPTINYRVR